MVPRSPEPPPADPELLSAARTRVVATGVQARESEAGEPDAGESFVVPARISRFTLLRPIGEGGMGVVFSAYDDELDRKVAIKLLRPSSGDSLGTARLQREAQAMARLAHPNIVRVYEVGAIEGRIYLVMEMVQGDTLRAWLRAGRRGWREVLAVLVQAGRGLAAAHAAGLVHRDFKPDNVIVAEDGFVRVLDFGLARAFTPGEGSTTQGERPLQVTASASGYSLGGASDQLTQEGTLIGTPAYMSPEQFACAAIDAPSDQFSFCVVLYEGLYGRRPFKARGGADLCEQIAALQAGEAPRGGQVPARVRRIVLRGLAERPQDRWPSMAALLAALERDPWQRGRLWLAGVGIAAAATGASYALIPRAATEPALCQDGAGELVGVWDEGRRAAVERGLLATGAAQASDVAARVLARLDAYAAQWVATYTASCAATQIRGEQSAHLMDLQMACLDGRRQELGLLAEALAGADAGMVEHAVAAALGLGAIDRCVDNATLQAAIPPPEDPALAAAVAELRTRLAKVRLAGSLGHFGDSVEMTRDVVREAARLGYRPLLAEALVREGDLLDYAGDSLAAERSLADAFFLAGTLGDTDVQSEAAIALTFVVGVEQSRFAEGLLWDRHAEMLLARLGEPPGRTIARLSGRGGLLDRAGRYPEARATLLQAQALAEAKLGASDVMVATVAHNLAAVMLAEGDLAGAAAAYDRALTIYTELLGPDSLSVAETVNNVGMVKLQEGDLEGAEAAFVRSLAGYERSVGGDHPRLGFPLVNLGAVALARRDFARAQAVLSRALGIAARAKGAGDPHVAEALTGGAELAAAQGRRGEARALAERALAIHAAAQTGEVPALIGPLCVLGEAALAEAAWGEARERFTRAVQVVEASYGPEDVAMLTALRGLARVALGERRAREGLAPLERAARIAASRPVPRERLAALQMTQAQVLWAVGEERARAVALAGAARDGYAAVGERTAADQAEVAAWLAAHRLR
ncbi:MAG: serine/threonine protein kinase [Myxococcales bacterium]|nr:serine/threonine protein kinase [Myxococcales bacterium]